jgi:hypothetical protein
MNLEFQHADKTYANSDPAALVAAGMPLATVNTALKDHALRMVSAMFTSFRSKLDGKSAGLIAEYRIKEEIMRDPENADPDELAILSREAAAFGEDIDWLLARIGRKAKAYRTTALMIGALEAEAKVAINEIPDDAPDIKIAIMTALGESKAVALTAFEQAQINIGD